MSVSENKAGKVGVLLINLGTPDAPTLPKVYKYLTEFLNDPRVIDIPWLARKLLVNAVIIPFRVANSTKIYKEVWEERGSPLLYYGNRVKELLQESLGENYVVELGMRYQSPSLDTAMKVLEKQGVSKLILLPMYPHYASSSTGTAIQKSLELLAKWYVIPETKVIGQYFDHPGYIKTIVERTKKFNLSEFDHILFSYHGLPVRQVDKVYNSGLCSDRDCENEITDENLYCYKATCYATTRELVRELKIPEDRYTVGFQSRLDKNWLEPFSDKIVIQKAKEGVKKMLVFSPAFTSDCLETIVEIGKEYQELFEENGGEKIELVESLNDHPYWIETLKDLVLKG